MNAGSGVGANGATLTGAFDEALAARIEDAGINSSAPREQRWIDGWLLRFSPGKARRARCIQPVAPGRLGIADKLALCLPVFASAGLHPFVRITPFAQPPGLDDHLATLGWNRIEETRVMILASLAAFGASASRAAADERIETVEAPAFAEWIGAARGSSAGARQAHADRILHSPVAHHAAWTLDENGAPMGGGQVVIEGDVAGLFDVFTDPAHRGRGLAERLCRHLLAFASRTGAQVGYLQVDAGNEAARRIYGRMGFADAYSYHYRTPPGGDD